MQPIAATTDGSGPTAMRDATAGPIEHTCRHAGAGLHVTKYAAGSDGSVAVRAIGATTVAGRSVPHSGSRQRCPPTACIATKVLRVSVGFLDCTQRARMGLPRALGRLFRVHMSSTDAWRHQNSSLWQLDVPVRSVKLIRYIGRSYAPNMHI
mmetsp:Transcript_54427/g.138280  ORF Transcript_54427/g.138280 Transcript_54427/m.138280 type:complete len:152 (-) Transcript_54427:223-678(-)